MAHVMKTAGSRTVTLGELENLPAPESMGRFHRPIPLGETVNAWYAALTRASLVVVKTDLAINSKNTKLFGVFDIARNDLDGPYSKVGHSLSIGFRTSTDETLGNRAVAGNRVTVCDNLILSGAELVLSRKSTTYTRLPYLIDRGIPIVKRQWAQLDKELENMQWVSVSTQRAKAVLYDIFQARAVPSRLFHTVHTTYFHPAPSETDVQPRNLYGIHNALTRAIKGLEPQPAFDATIRVHKALVAATTGDVMPGQRA